MKINYTITLEDYKEALRLHKNQTFGMRIGIFFTYRVLPILGIFILIYVAFKAFTQENDYAQNPPFGLIMPILFVFLPVIRNYLVRRQFDIAFPLTKTDRKVSADIDEERILSTIPGFSEGKFYWNAISGFAQNEKIVQFYLSSDRIIFIPISSLSPSQLAELGEIVARNLVRKEK